jgi:transcriptional regulator with XRE-family HTH domain
MDLSSLQIWERLSEVAKKQGKPLQQAYRAVGLGKGTISGWKESFPRVDKIAAIADFYGVSLDSLVYGSEKNHRKYSSLTLKIAEAADRLNDEGKETALNQVEALEKRYPLDVYISSNKAT